MTYISRKTRLLVPHWIDECDPAYLYHLHRKRSDGRLKRHSSCDDLRAWVDNEYLNYQYLLELMTDGEVRRQPFYGLVGRFIPVEVILDLMCGDRLRPNASNYLDGEGYDDTITISEGRRSRVAYQGLKSGSTMTFTSVPTDHALKITNAAMAKLENINNIISRASDDDVNGICHKQKISQRLSGKQSSMAEVKRDEEKTTSPMGEKSREELKSEYNDKLRKISLLKQKLFKIQERRDVLNNKIESYYQDFNNCITRETDLESHRRDDQPYVRTLQKMIEKLICERGRILKEMCMELNYLNGLKQKIDLKQESSRYFRNSEDQSGNECPCGKQNALESQDIPSYTVFAQELRSNGETNTNLRESSLKKLDKNSQDDRISYRKCADYSQNGTEMLYMKDMRGAKSSEATVTGSSNCIIETTEEQQVYDFCNRNESIPERKFKSETTMTELEQTLRSYEQRLCDLEGLEVQVEALKKNAVLADYFKQRWLRCTIKEKARKDSETEKMRKEIGELSSENTNLRNAMQKLCAKSEKEQKEIQVLRYKQMQLSQMEEEMVDLRKELGGYQISCQTQKECIGRLEDIVTDQREEIEKLRMRIMRLCRMAKFVKDEEKSKGNLRSRSYGSENKKPVNHKKVSQVVSSDEDSSNNQCCNHCVCHMDITNRPQSEGGRRLGDRNIESFDHQQTCRRQSCYY